MFRSTDVATSTHLMASLKTFDFNDRGTVANGSSGGDSGGGDSEETNSENLVGLDAVIPGGKYDDSPEQNSNEESNK